jgi:hypothetical protein
LLATRLDSFPYSTTHILNLFCLFCFDAIDRIKNCLDPSWAEPIYYEHPSGVDDDDVHVEVSIYDDNRGKKDDRLMAKTMVNLKEAINHPQQGIDIELDDGGM